MKQTFILLLVGACAAMAQATGREYYVSTSGHDTASGAADAPLRTIQEAANRAMPGDTITVHEGIYRERIDPPRGGESDDKRITYQAAPGATVVIKGSEVVDGWENVEHDTWRVILPNAFFGDFNPYADEIRGDWFHPLDRKHHTGAVYLDGHWLAEAAEFDEVMAPAGEQPLWFGSVDGENTTIHAQLPGVDPNVDGIEINVRQAVFYPGEPGRNYITVRGFTMEHAATNWAPPTAEQIGLIGTHWSKGWIIEDNIIRYSVCTGITLGKHGDEFDNTSADTAEGYVETIRRGLAAGWSKENIGHHIVRGNHISHCEQAGIVGSLGPAFSLIERNHIHDIHVRQLFSGHEQAGIKLHAPIDTIIRDNHIHRASRGIWLDWMTQGTHVTRNLVHDISPREDLYVEVNHGPFLIDHNIFLSDIAILDISQGGAYAHNLVAGRIIVREGGGRETPWHPAHSTEIAGLATIQGGDNRFIHNLFIAPAGLDRFDEAGLPMMVVGNLYLNGATPSGHETNPAVAEADPQLRLSRDSDGAWWLELTLEKAWAGDVERAIVTSGHLGRAVVPDQPFVQPDGSPHRLDQDFFGNPRNADSAFPGPFEIESDGRHRWKIRSGNGFP